MGDEKGEGEGTRMREEERKGCGQKRERTKKEVLPWTQVGPWVVFNPTQPFGTGKDNQPTTRTARHVLDSRVGGAFGRTALVLFLSNCNYPQRGSSATLRGMLSALVELGLSFI